jgi:hypothetical protein
MAWNFQTRLRHVGTRIKALNYIPVTYRRYDEDDDTATYADITVNASPILGEALDIHPGVNFSRVEIQDWVIDKADLIFGGVPTLPQRNDRIINPDNGDEFVMMPQALDEPFYKFTTSLRERFLIHTQRVKRSDA